MPAPPSARERATPDRYEVTVGQVCLTRPEDVVAQVEQVVEDHPASELFVFAEFVCHGDDLDLDSVSYLQDDPETREVADQWIRLTPPYAALRKIVERADKALVVGVLAQQGDGLASRAAFYDAKTGQTAHYDKTHVHWTEKLLRPGDSLEPLETRFGKMGMLVCYDLAFVEPTRVYGLKGTELLVVLSAIPQRFHWKYAHRRCIGAAIFNQYYVVAAHQGHTTDSPMGGHSAIFDAEGALLAHLDGTHAGSVTATIDLGEERRWRAEEVIDRHRRPDLYGALW